MRNKSSKPLTSKKNTPQSNKKQFFKVQFAKQIKEGGGAAGPEPQNNPSLVAVMDATLGISERIFEQQQNRSRPRYRSASLEQLQRQQQDQNTNNNQRNTCPNCGGLHTIFDCRLLSLNLWWVHTSRN